MQSFHFVNLLGCPEPEDKRKALSLTLSLIGERNRGDFNSGVLRIE